MKRLLYIISYPFIKFISKLPFKILYKLSDLLYLLLYNLFKYRKSVVRKNLELALPDSSELERKKIEKKFYRHFCDLILETVKVFSISKQELKERFKITNPEVIHELEAQGKSVIYMCAHYNNYEWILALRFHGMKNTSYGIYKKLKNKAFDDLLRKSRSKFETYLIDKEAIPKKMAEDKLKNKKANYGMIADQSPKRRSARNWLEFMGLNTPVFTGSELLAKRLDLAVVYMKIEKVGRGYYETVLEPVTTQAKKTDNGEITKAYFKKLESQIYRRPEFYLWTHKRWKYKNQYDRDQHIFF